jgi:hypothetical protein
MKSWGAQLLSGLIAVFFSASASATVIDFEHINMTSAPSAPVLSTGDYITQGIYTIEMQDLNNVVRPLGLLSNGSHPGSCLNGSCPVGNSTNFLSSYNDALVHVSRTDGQPLVFGGVSAAYNPPVDAVPANGLYFAVEADRADGSYATYAYRLPSTGEFTDITNLPSLFLGGSGTLTTGVVTDLFFYGYYCNVSGSCNAFKTGKGQFGLDKIVFNDGLSPVSEPETSAMLLAGLGLVGAVARRRQKRARIT